MRERFYPSLLNVFATWMLFFVCHIAIAADAPGVSITVSTNGGHPISPRLVGVFFEDINFGGDGGLNADLVKNGAFEFPDALMGWQKLSEASDQCHVTALTESPIFSESPHYLQLVSRHHGEREGVANQGFRGMGFEKGRAYRIELWARSTTDRPAVIRARMVKADGTVLAELTLPPVAGDWQQRTGTLSPSITELHGHLELLLDSPGGVDVDWVSLVPTDTWRNRPHGLRADLVQKLADLKPAFLRFPGGCIVEGSELKYRYQWKTTIGALHERKLLINRWNYEFKHRPTPDYFQSFALGFYEYFLLSEDLGAEPLPIVNCGMACQFNSGELVPLDQLQPFIQDALDLIEFANGGVDTPWGAKRAAMGHPTPFHMKLIGIGNEQWGPQYIERYELFAKALQEKHPEIELVTTSGPSPGDERFQFLWPRLRELKAQIIDEHVYAMPDWFLKSATRYDEYDRSGPKVFMGEYAAQTVAITSPMNRNNVIGALSEAAFLTGIERNSDVVVMSSYAPLFGHEEAWQWRPNLIWFDNLMSYATPNYYVQQLFALNRGDVTFPITITDPRTPDGGRGQIGLGTFHTAAEFKDLTVTHGEAELYAARFPDGRPEETYFGGKWSCEDGVLRQSDANGVGTLWLGSRDWTDYTIRLKARRTDGEEGFMIIFRKGYGGSYAQWNIGGWKNTQHGIQVNYAGDESIVAQVPGSIESNRWYDIRVEIEGNHVHCYLDDELVQDVDLPANDLPRIFACASRDTAKKQAIVKIVNPTPNPTIAALRLDGFRLTGTGATTELAGHPDDINSIANPTHVQPVTHTVTDAARTLEQQLAPYSLTIVRLDLDE
ncbi:MAG: alpha-L-arabinofuranosidase C-terminal domain-containing protein [Pirellulaceae bacterium]|nr:DUF1080 domain-containing protein [Planctomycetales bacterium]